MIQTSVSTKYQVVIPKEVRKKIEVKPGQKFNVNVLGDQIVFSPAKGTKQLNWPSDHTKLLKNPWKNEDPLKYLKEERDSWD